MAESVTWAQPSGRSVSPAEDKGEGSPADRQRSPGKASLGRRPGTQGWARVRDCRLSVATLNFQFNYYIYDFISISKFFRAPETGGTMYKKMAAIPKRLIFLKDLLQSTSMFPFKLLITVYRGEMTTCGTVHGPNCIFSHRHCVCVFLWSTAACLLSQFYHSLFNVAMGYTLTSSRRLIKSDCTSDSSNLATKTQTTVKLVY